MPYGGSTGRFSASRFAALHYRQDWIINQTWGEGDRGGSSTRANRYSTPIPCRVLVGSSIKRIDVHVLSRNPRRKRRTGSRIPVSFDRHFRRCVSPFGKYQTVHADIFRLSVRSARPIFDIQYPERTYIHDPPHSAIFSPLFPSPSPRRDKK